MDLITNATHEHRQKIDYLGYNIENNTKWSVE